MIVVGKIKKKHRQESHVDVIFDIPNNPQSYASSVLLKDNLKQQDESFIFDQRVIKILEAKGSKIWHQIKERVFLRVERHYGTLTCTICMRKVVRPEGTTKLKDHHATIEHIQARSEGGYKFALHNLTCSCNKCNNERGNKPLFKKGKHKYSF